MCGALLHARVEEAWRGTSRCRVEGYIALPSKLQKNYFGTAELRGLARPTAARDTRDWRERRDTCNQGLCVSSVALDVPVARLRALADLFRSLLCAVETGTASRKHALHRVGIAIRSALESCAVVPLGVPVARMWTVSSSC